MRYTRDGNFTLASDGRLVTRNGDDVQGENGAITLQGNTIRINEDGLIEVDGQMVDTLNIVDFEDLSQLEKDGQNLFVHQGDGETEELPAEGVAVQQGALELSNISSVHEMTHMIEMHRLFETYQKVIQSFDEMDTKVITEVGRSPA